MQSDYWAGCVYGVSVLIFCVCFDAIEMANEDVSQCEMNINANTDEHQPQKILHSMNIKRRKSALRLRFHSNHPPN